MGVGNMKISLEGLQRNALISWNELIKTIGSTKRDRYNQVSVDADRLERTLASLRDDIVMLASLIDPETGKSVLDEDTEVLSWQADDEDDDDY